MKENIDSIIQDIEEREETEYYDFASSQQREYNKDWSKRLFDSLLCSAGDASDASSLDVLRRKIFY